MSGPGGRTPPSYTPLGVGAPRPKHEDRMRQVNQAQADYERVLQEAGSLYQDLCDHPSLKEIWEELNKRINTMLAEDQFCVALVRIIHGYRTTLDAPRLAEEKLKTIMGPVLMEAMSKEPASAP